MNGSKEEWYRDRIIWRAKQHNLVGNGCELFTNIEQAAQQQIHDISSLEGRPVIVFSGSSGRWTVLTPIEVMSSYDGQLSGMRLDDINKKISTWSSDGAVDKSSTEFLLLGDGEVRVWAPMGKPLHALWSILGMFPLDTQATNN